MKSLSLIYQLNHANNVHLINLFGISILISANNVNNYGIKQPKHAKIAHLNTQIFIIKLIHVNIVHSWGLTLIKHYSNVHYVNSQNLFGVILKDFVSHALKIILAGVKQIENVWNASHQLPSSITSQKNASNAQFRNHFLIMMLNNVKSAIEQFLHITRRWINVNPVL